MAAVADEEVVAGGEGRREVVALGRPAGGPQDAVQLGGDDGRPAPLVGQAGGDEPDDAHRPGAADQRRREVGRLPGEDRPGLLEGRPGDVPAGHVGALQGRRGGSGLLGVGRQQERSRVRGLSHPAGRVEARSEGVGHGLQRRGGRLDAGGGKERGDPRAGAPSGSSPGRGARWSGSRRGRERRRPRCRSWRGPQDRRPSLRPGSPASRSSEQRRDLERDAAPRQAAVRVGGIGTVRVDDRERPAA